MGEIKNLSRSEAIEKIQNLATTADICMFVTSLSKVPLTARPMSTVEVDDQGNIWFISKKSSDKNKAITLDNKVQLLYASKGNAEFMNVYGEAEIVIDKQKAEEVWTSIAKAWLPGGVDDPELSLIKVKPLDTYYWDTKHGKLISLIKIATAVITGKTMDDGVEGSIKVNRQ